MDIVKSFKAMIAMMFVNIGPSKHRCSRNDQRWCLVEGRILSYGATPVMWYDTYDIKQVECLFGLWLCPCQQKVNQHHTKNKRKYRGC